MWTLVGFALIILASLLETYCAFGRLAKPEYKPGLLKTPLKWVLEVLWVLMLMAGGIAILVDAIISTGLWWLAIVGVVLFWLVLPFFFTPMVRYRLLPRWDEVKKLLEPTGLNDKNYWREDWWMVEDKRKHKATKKKT